MEPTSSTRRYGKFAIEVRTGGHGAKPLLFLHGEEGLRNDHAFLRELEQDFTVHAPHHPGFAGSERKVLPASFAELVNLYLYLLRDIARPEGRGVVLVGAGFGAWVAAELALRSPDQVSELCLVSPVGIRTRPATEREIADVFDMDLSELRSLWFAGQGEDFLEPTRMQDGDWTNLVHDREGLARYAWVPYMHDPALANALELIEAPTLCLWNSGDRAVREGYYEDFAARVPGARTVVLEGGGHFPLLRDPKSCIAALRTLIGAAPSTKGRNTSVEARV